MKQTRRQFLASATTAGAGLAFAGVDVKAAQPAPKEGFGIKIYATRWGYGGTYDQFCSQVKAEGYDGVEDWLPGDSKQADALFEALEKHGLAYGALVGSGGRTHADHVSSYQSNLKRALERKPDFINCHAGKDYFSKKESDQLLKIGIATAKESGVPVYQETHRGRMLFAPHIALQYLKEHKELKLGLDISHWCVVAESLLADQPEAVKLALDRTGHIHARIGHEEGPQVPEPHAPEWKRARDAHFAWWDEVVARKKAAGELLTMTTEFGPANYMWSLPYTRQPLADQWGVNVRMMNDWRKRYL